MDDVNPYMYVNDDPVDRVDPTGEVDINFVSLFDNHGRAVHDALERFNPTNFYTIGGHAAADGGGYIQDQRGWTDKNRDFVALRAYTVYRAMFKQGYNDGEAILAFGCHLADSSFPADLARFAKAPVIAGHGFTAISGVKGDSNKVMLTARRITMRSRGTL